MSNEENTNSVYASFRDLTSLIVNQRACLCFYLLITEHPTQAGLNRKEMNLLTWLEILRHTGILLAIPYGYNLSCVLSQTPPPCEVLAILSLISLTGKIKKKEKTENGFWKIPEDIKELSQKIALSISMCSNGSVLSQPLEKWTGLLSDQLYALRPWV